MAKDKTRVQKLKTYAGQSFVVGFGSKQMRVIVAAKSRSEARRILEASGVRMTVGEMRDYWSETGNNQEVLAASMSPGTVLFRELDNYHGPFTALNKRKE